MSSVNIDDFIRNVKDNDRTTPKNVLKKQEDRRSDKTSSSLKEKERTSFSKGLTISTDENPHGVKLKHAVSTKNQTTKASDPRMEQT